MKKIRASALLLRVILALVFVGCLSGCNNLLFYPSKQWRQTPADLNLEYQDITLSAADGTRLSAWWLPAQREVKGSVLFLHGNAENISTHIHSVSWLPAQGYQVLLLDYRGYGHSAGSPSLPEVFSDIEAGLTWLVEAPETQGKPKIVLGQSLGAAMGGYVIGRSTNLSSAPWREYLDAVILDSGFTGYRAIAREAAASHWLTWSLQYPVSLVMPGDYDLLDVVGNISPVPLLLIHGTQDRVIPYHHVETLFAAANNPKSKLRFDGPHIATFNDKENQQLVLEFLSRVIPEL
ncbi:alpha/beta hydrolase [Maricurvus nonylphenolicus]|uniref:alpha/beta hydrolase n=1 Tax=Maricurvus nonylphenolicus TaxID=1008307 RepID=UPI0036F2CB30